MRLAEELAKQRERLIAGRLAAPFDVYAPMRRDAASDRNLHRVRIAAAEVLVGQPQGRPDSRAAAVARLLTGDVHGAVAALTVIARDRPSADVFADLAAAHLEVGSSSEVLGANLDALAAADRALKIEPAHPAALVNRALALGRLGFAAEARDAWGRVATGDPIDGWRDEAQRAAALLDAPPQRRWDEAEVERTAAVGDRAALRRMLRDAPRVTRSFGEGVFPAKWGEASLRGDAAGADRALAAARTIGAILADEYGERMTADSVAVIDRAGPTASTLARAYVRYRGGSARSSRSAAGRGGETAGGGGGAVRPQ